MSKYRMYIDESGSHYYSIGNKNDEKDRYLCLLGVIISEEENERYFDPAWSDLRGIFTEDVDFPCPLHYVDVLNRRDSFEKLVNESIRVMFDTQYMSIISMRNYVLCCVVLDKKTHFERYGESALHPYHYCFNVMLERYVMFLRKQNGVGDIVVEIRGKKEDRKMKEAYTSVYTGGTQFMSSAEIRRCVQSHTVKFCRKENLVSGIEFADMLATPMKYFVLSQYNLHTLSDNFSKKVLEELVIRRKIISSSEGNLKGYGVKLLS